MRQSNDNNTIGYQIGEVYITRCSSYYWSVHCGNPGKARTLLFFRNIQTEAPRDQVAALLRQERKRNS